MSLTHTISRDGATSAHMRREKVDQIQAAIYEERAESSRRAFLSEEVAGLNERAGSSRRLLDMPPSWLIDQHSACVGICPYTGYGHSLPSSGHNAMHHQDAHSMKGAYEMEEATSAPACTSQATWQGATCQASHTTHYHHHYYHNAWHHGPIRSSHACATTRSCCAINTPHDFSSHGGPPINCPVNISARQSPAPAKPAPVPTSQSKRFTKQEQEEKDLYAAEETVYAEAAAPSPTVPAAKEAPPLTVFKAGPPPLKLCSRQLPPFPSIHASPYVLCQYCSRVLLLPPGTLLFPPSGTLLLESFILVKLKCGYCLNISKFSTRHLHRASTSSLVEGTCSSAPSPFELSSMPSCITSNGVMLEASALNHNETEEPLNGIFEPTLVASSLKAKVLSNGNVKHNLELNFLETGTPLNGVCEHTSNQNHIETSEPLNGICGDSAQSKIVETGVVVNGECAHPQENVIKTGESLNGICEDLAQSKHVETGAVLNGKCAYTQEIVIETAEPLNGMCGYLAQPDHLETGTLVNGNCRQTEEDKGNEAGLNGICEDTSALKEIKIGVQNGAMHDSHSDREQEITAFSSVQDWVDSLSVEIGYESDNQLQGPLNCPNDCIDGLEKFGSSRHRSPLHQHFGYSSPSELFEKVLFSEDEEIKARTETNSTASSSFSSNNACQPSETKSPSIHVHAPSLRSWRVNPDSSGVIGSTEQDAQRSLAGLLRKSLKRGSLLPASPKTRVVVNGHALSSAAIKQAEERAGKLRPGSYWYDCKAGFWGVEGGPCLGILPPYIAELNYPMTNDCSNGDTQVYVNGRELHVKDLAVLSQRGLFQKAGRAYALGFDGVVIDETTGLELKHLGKLAPTVERKGKGFGMFTADVLQSKASAVHQIKLANSSR